MFYVARKKYNSDCYGVVDSRDKVEEDYSIAEVMEFYKRGIVIEGVKPLEAANVQIPTICDGHVIFPVGYPSSLEAYTTNAPDGGVATFIVAAGLGREFRCSFYGKRFNRDCFLGSNMILKFDDLVEYVDVNCFEHYNGVVDISFVHNAQLRNQILTAYRNRFADDSHIVQ